MPDQQSELPVMYGIPNCDTIKKARNWLKTQDVEYRFHDYKKQGVNEQQLREWLSHFGWEQLINKRGTTWRKLDDTTKDNMDNEAALTVMLNNPSIIKRPILLANNKALIGFDADSYQQVFNT